MKVGEKASKLHYESAFIAQPVTNAKLGIVPLSGGQTEIAP